MKIQGILLKSINRDGWEKTVEVVVRFVITENKKMEKEKIYNKTGKKKNKNE